jgi:hypothetical protein
MIMLGNSAATVLVAATIAASAVTQATYVRAATKFDGAWSVVVFTRSGPCDPTYRVSGQIVNGEISYSYGSVDVVGHVKPSGVVSVRVTSGSNYAVGSGRLTATSGSGTWHGRGPDGYCSGTWSATRA